LALPNPSATYQIAFEGRNNYGRANVIDNVVVEETPSCIAPTALVSSNLAATSATLSWTAASPAPSGGYDYFISTSATVPLAGTTPTGSVAAGVITANVSTGIVANTLHYFWVRSNCGSGQLSSWAGSSTFTTPRIEPTNQPTDFAVGTVTTTAIPLTWTAAAAGSQLPDGYFIQGSSVSLAAIPDPVDGTDPVDVLAYTSGAANKKQPLGASTGTTSFTSASMTQGTMYYYEINSYTNSGATIDFLTTGTPSLNHATRPNAATSGSFTASSSSNATINWTVPAGYDPARHTTLVFVKPTSAVTPGVPTSVVSGYTASTVFGSGTPFQNDAAAFCVFNGDNGGSGVSISGLSGSTTYHVLIYQVVEAPNSNSTCSYSAALTASGTTVKPEPTNQPTNFAVGSVTTTAIPLTWTAALPGSQLPDGYLVQGSSVNLAAIADPVDGTEPANLSTYTSNAARFRQTNGASINTPSFGGMVQGTMYFYKINSFTNSGATIDFLTTGTPSLNHATRPIAATSGSFTASSSSNATINWTVPAGYDPSRHTTLVFVKPTSAVTQGTPTSVVSGYTASTVFGSGTPFQNDAAAFCVFNGDNGGSGVGISGLSASTTYHVLIYQVMEAANSNGTCSYSAALVANGNTPCVAGTVPFFEGFESGFTHNTPVGGCWSQQTVTGSDVWTANASLTDYNRSPRTGSRNAFLAYSNDDWLFYALQLTGGVSYTFDVYARQNTSTPSRANITLAYGTTASAAGMTNTVLSSSAIIDGNYQLNSGTFTPVSSGVYFIGVKGFMNSDLASWYVSIDDISVYETPSCSALPTALSSSLVNSSSATISWSPASPAPGNGYQYFVSTSATAPTAVTAPTGSTAAGVTSINITTGISALTQYYYWVRSNCDGTNFSNWAGSGTFTTPCAAITSLPWTEGFEGLTSVSTSIYPACWLETNGTLWRSQDVSTTTYNNPRTGTKYIGCDYSGTNNRIWTPGFQLTAGVSYEFSTYFVGDGFSGWTGDIVYNTSQSAAGETVLGAAFISSSTTSTSGTNYAQISRTFVAPATATYHFGVRITSTSTPWSSMGFDDFSLTQLANCSGAPSAGTPPVGTNVCSGATTTLTVTGATTGSGISYQWEEWNGSAWVSAVGGSGATTTSFTTPALTATKQYRFTVLCTPSSQSASTSGVTITVGAQANDACASAQVLTIGAPPVTGNVSCAAAGSGGCGGSTSNYDVWYSFTVVTPGNYRVNLSPSASFDGVFQLYTTSCGGALVSSSNNTSGSSSSCIDGFVAGFPEYATYNLAAGTYFVRVYDYNASGTAYPSTTDFTIEVVSAIDPCSLAQTITCGSAVNTVIAPGIGEWAGFVECDLLTYSLFGREAIYAFTPTLTSSNYSITVNSLSPNGGGNNVSFGFVASACSQSGSWNCIDALNAVGTTATFSMTAGFTYYFIVKPEFTTGYTVNWRINCPAPPVNDACANATPLPCGTTNLAGTTVECVTETVSIGCTMSPFGVWYSFEGNGFSTTISSTATFDHEMGIASGSCGALVNIACRDAASSGSAETHTFTTTLGETYYVYIGHWSSASTITGTFTISRTCTVNEWTGNAGNNDWATNGNWSTGTAPTSGGTAFIPTTPVGSNFPIIDEAAQIGTLIIRPGASVSIQSGNSMTVSGVLTNNGTVNVASGGSLVQTATSTLAGSGIYNVTRAGSAVYDYWSSPITNASTGLLGSTVYEYQPGSGTADPGDDAFDPGWVTAGGSMAVGKGYAAYGAGTRTFTGTVNNGQVDAAVVHASNPTPTLGGVPYNLIGNPYPSAVNVGDFLTLNSSKLATGAVYLWDDPGSSPYVTGNYATLNNATYIAGGGNTPNPGPRIGSLQGFKVQVNATVNTPGNGFLRFTNAMRTATNTSVLFRQAERKLLWLSTVSATNSYNQLAVGFFEDGTDGEDWGYDAPKLNALGVLSFFSYMDGSPYGIQVYGELEPERVVPLGLNSQSQTMVTIALDSTENITEDVILEDRHMGIFHDLRQSSYVFQSASTLYEDRFFLHFAPQMVTSLGESSESDATIYMHDGRLFLSTSETFKGAVRMVDISGRMVWQATDVTVDPSGRSFDMQHLSRGVYVVMMEGREGTFNAKVTR
jgi:hypothetical protein